MGWSSAVVFIFKVQERNLKRRVQGKRSAVADIRAKDAITRDQVLNIQGSTLNFKMEHIKLGGFIF